MMILEKLRQLNEDMLAINTNKDDKKEIKKQKTIQKMLKDDRCFFKMTIEQSYGVLRDLGIEEGALRQIYLELIDSKDDEPEQA